MANPDYGDIKKTMLPIFNSLVESIFDGDFKSFSKHHPPAPEAAFNKAVSILKPLGKPIKLEYLGHLVKLDRTKVLCKVTYSDSPEELVWDFNLKRDDGEFKLINLGFDK